MGEAASTKTRTRVILVVINVITIGALIWSLRQFKLAAFVTDLKSVQWWWIVLAILSDIGVYVLQAVRWRLLLHPVEPVSLWQTVRGIYVGLFGNEALGFNAGEVVRCYLISRWTALPLSVSLSSALIERIFDGIWLAGALFLAMRIVPPLPTRLRELLVGSEYILSAVVLAGAALLAIALFYRHKAQAALSTKNWQRHLRVLIDDLSLIGHSRYLYLAFAVSLPFLLAQTVPIYATIHGYTFSGLSLRDAFALMVILRAGSAVPQAPGNIGMYLLMRENLMGIFHVNTQYAEDFSVLLVGIFSLRLVIGGLIALAVTGARIGEFRRAAHAEHAELSKSRD